MLERALPLRAPPRRVAAGQRRPPLRRRLQLFLRRAEALPLRKHLPGRGVGRCKATHVPARARVALHATST